MGKDGGSHSERIISLSGTLRMFVFLTGILLLSVLPMSSHMSRAVRSTHHSWGAPGVPGRDVVSVIVPTFNERSNIAVLIYLILEELDRLGESGEVVVVDDSSPDGTAEVVRQLQSTYGEERVVLVEREGKLGLGSAYLAGMDAAKGSWVILMDADLSHRPSFIGSFIEEQRRTGADVVSGTRYVRGGGVEGWTLRRKIVSNGANVLAKSLLVPSSSDLTGSFRLYRAEALREILPQVQAKGYAFQLEIIARARAAGLVVAEVPIVFVDRLFGESKLAASEIVEFARGLIRLVFTL